MRLRGKPIGPWAKLPRMTDTPWLGDACSLAEAFRSGERNPKEELEAVLGAIEASRLNAVSFVDAVGARSVAGVVERGRPWPLVAASAPA